MTPPIEPFVSIDQLGPVRWGHAVVQAGVVGLGTAAIMAVRGSPAPLALAVAGIGAITAFGSWVVRDVLRSRRS